MATIDYASKYAQKIDERFSLGALTSGIINQDYDFVGVKTVKVYNVSTAAMNDYTRSGSNRYGTPSELEAPTQEMTMTQDRSFTFTIDKMNEEETGGALNAGKALSRQLNEVVIPEVDAYRYSVIAANAGKTADAVAITDANVYDLIIAGTEELDENKVPVQGRELHCTPAVYKAMKKSKDIVLDTDISQEMKAKGVIAMIDGMAIKKIPSSYFPKGVGFIITMSIATVAPVKLSEYKIHTDVPGISGSLVEGRVYYDAFVLDNKKKAIYVQAIPTT